MKATYFDQENISKYNINPWDKTYKLGLYFTALSEIGDHMDLHLALEEDGQFKWYKTPHALHDAFSAIKTLFKEKNISLKIQDKNEYIQSPWISSIFRALRSVPKQKHILRDQAPLTTGGQFQYAFVKMDKLKTPYSTTALFSNIVAKICMKELTNNSISRWMIPVRTFNKEGMSASYLGLNIDKDDTLKNTQDQLTHKLKSGEHWGYYYISMIGLFLGKWFIKTGTKKSLEKSETRWLGSISNLGNIGITNEAEDFLILPSVRWHRPIGILLYEFNNIQYITLSLHESLNNINPNEIIDEIQRQTSNI